MKRWLVLIIAVIAFLFLGLMALAYFLPQTQFVQQYRTQIEQELTKQLGTEVALNGDIGIGIIPRLSISVTDAVVKNPAPHQGDLARMGKLDAEIKVLPLIRQEIQTGKIKIEEPFFQYSVDADGVSNIQPILDKISSGSEGEAASSSSSNTDSVAVAINGIDIRNGEIRYQDLKSQQQFHFTNVDLAMGAFDFNSRSSLQFGFNVKSNLFEPEVRTQLESYLRINLNKQQYFLDENTISFNDARSTALVKSDLIALDLNNQQVVANNVTLNTKRGTFALEGQIDRLESTQNFDVLSIAGIAASLDEERGSANAVINAAHYTLSSGALIASGAQIDAKAPQATATINIADIAGELSQSNILNAKDVSGAVKVGDLPYNVDIPNIGVDLNALQISVPRYSLTNNVSNAEGSVDLTIADAINGSGAIAMNATELQRIVHAAIGENIDALDTLQNAKVLGNWSINGSDIALKVDEGALNQTAFSSSIQANYENMTGDVIVNLGEIVIDDYMPKSSSPDAQDAAPKGEFVMPVVPTGFTLQLNAKEVVYKEQDLRVEGLGVYANPTSPTSADVRVEGRVDIPDQQELIATSISASINQGEDLLSLMNINATASNSQLSAEVKGQSLDIEMQSGDMRIKSPSIFFNMDDTRAELNAPAFLYSMNSANMSLNDLAGSVKNGAMNASVNIADLNANLNDLSVQSQSSTVRFSGDVEADLGLQNVVLNMQEGMLEVGRIQMSGDSGQLGGSAKVRDFTNLLKVKAEVDLKGDSINFPLLAEQFGVSYTPVGEGALTNASLDLAGRFSLSDIQIERGHFESDGGLVDVSVNTDQGVRDIKLSARDINFSNWLPVESDSAEKSVSSSQANKVAASPLALFLTDSSHGTVNLLNVVIAGARLDAADAKINVTGQNVSLSPVNVTLYGGTSTADIHYNYGSGAIEFTDALTQLALGDLLKDMDITSIFDGTGSMQFNGGARGGDAPLLNRLNGQGKLSINDGQLLGINFKKVLVEGYSLFKKSKGQDYSYDGNVDDATQFASLTSELAVNSGIANSTNIQLIAPALRVVGDGSFDLNSLELDYQFTAFVDEGFDGQGSEVDLASMSNGIPISITGSATSPKIRVDLGALAKKEVDKVIDKELNRAAQKAADKLGGDSAKILDSILGTSISKEEEEKLPQESLPQSSSSPTEETVPLPNAQSQATTEPPVQPPIEEQIDPREKAEELLIEEAGKLLKGLFN